MKDEDGFTQKDKIILENLKESIDNLKDFLEMKEAFITFKMTPQFLNDCLENLFKDVAKTMLSYNSDDKGVDYSLIQNALNSQISIEQICSNILLNKKNKFEVEDYESE